MGRLQWKNSKVRTKYIHRHGGKMIEEWTTKFDLYHLNVTDQCKGTYTYNCNTGKSAIDHVLVNGHFMNKYKGMYIDEEKIQLNISDHCLVRVWFRIGTNNERTKWKKAKFKEIKWISKKENSLKNFEEKFLP